MPSASAPYLIAVTGGSGSGKTTLARTLFKRLGADRAVEMGEDNYYHPREHHGMDAPLWTAEEMERKVDFDSPASKDMDLFEAHVAALKRGESISQPHYDFSKHDRVLGKEETISPRPIVIVEGVHVLSEPILFLHFDLTVFVDTPPDIRLARRVMRDKRERGRDVERTLVQYLTYVRPAHARWTEPAKFNCDIVIQDEGPLATGMGKPVQRAADRLVAPVWSRLVEEKVI